MVFLRMSQGFPIERLTILFPGTGIFSQMISHWASVVESTLVINKHTIFRKESYNNKCLLLIETVD